MMHWMTSKFAAPFNVNPIVLFDTHKQIQTDVDVMNILQNYDEGCLMMTF